MNRVITVFILGMAISIPCFANQMKTKCEFIDLSYSLEPKETITLKLAPGSQIVQKSWTLSGARKLTAILVDKSQRMDYSDVRLQMVLSKNGEGIASTESKTDLLFATGNYSLKCTKK